jgi:DNA (cytosine-5)-methyltransferase 1
MRQHFTGEPLDGLIASPPCQAFSMAGKGAGRDAMDIYLAQIRRMAHGYRIERQLLDEYCGDERAHLVLEPLRWALALGPRWIACEQVEPVLPLWEAMGQALRQHGYHTATGILSAERYGVPQTRRRAILLASLDGPVELPAPTHARFVAPRNRDDEGGGLFDLPEPDRITLPEDQHLQPWVSMAEALGWAGKVRLRANAQANAAERAVDEPAPTITGGHDHAERVWTVERPATTVNGDPRISEPGHHDAEVSGSQQANAVRVSLAEALVLQSFPSDYPVQGTKTKQFEQVGNAVPPVLAWHVLRSVAEHRALTVPAPVGIMGL